MPNCDSASCSPRTLVFGTDASMNVVHTKPYSIWYPKSYEDSRESDTMHIAQKFEHLLDAYRHPDGRKWTGAELEKATSGVVPRSYMTNLRKGRIEGPGYEKIAAIAKAMGFPPAVWFEEDIGGGWLAGTAEEARGIGGRLEHLFEAIRNPKTGEPYTNAEVARMTLGDLSEEDVEGIRTGSVSDPTVGQVAALAGVFGVEPSYLLDRGEPPQLDAELVQVLRDEDVRDIARESSRLPDRERRLVLGIVRQFGDPGG
jgi:transcriptional regulator with XRE-family HTH domain